MSLSSLLSIARSALLTHQLAQDVAGHNIANATTEGYTRQRLRLAAAVPLATPIGQVGRGVTATGIERARDQFLDDRFREESGLSGQYGTLKDLLGQVEGVFPEPSDSGLGSTIDDFLSAWSNVANAPTDQTARSLLQQSATALAQSFQDRDNRLSEITNQAGDRLRDMVSTINGLGRQIADLNTRILAGNSGLGTPDLADQRDHLIDQLSQLVAVRVVPHADGTVGVVAGDVLLVDHSTTTALEIKQLSAGGLGVGVVGSSAAFNMGAGQFKAIADLTQKTLPDIQRQLDGLAKAIVTEVNALHRSGTGLNGAKNVDFFDPTGLTARTMALSSAVTLSTDNIAAGTSGGAGDGSLALRIGQLRTTGVASYGGQTLAQGYTTMVSAIGVQTRDATQRAAAQDTLVEQIRSQRASVTDVSIDEELTSMITNQHAFTAASRLVTVADQMIQDVIAMVR